MKQKKIPIRMCTACREGKSKKEMVRIVKNKEGIVQVDTTGKAQGRGAYICADIACLEKAIKTRAIERALETKIEDSTYEEIRWVILRREITG